MHPVYHANERLNVNSTSPGATGFPYISPISRHGHTDKGRVERGIERELYFTRPPLEGRALLGDWTRLIVHQLPLPRKSLKRGKDILVSTSRQPGFSGSQ